MHKDPQHTKSNEPHHQAPNQAIPTPLGIPTPNNDRFDPLGDVKDSEPEIEGEKNLINISPSV